MPAVEAPPSHSPAPQAARIKARKSLPAKALELLAFRAETAPISSAKRWKWTEDRPYALAVRAHGCLEAALTFGKTGAAVKGSFVAGDAAYANVASSQELAYAVGSCHYPSWHAEENESMIAIFGTASSAGYETWMLHLSYADVGTGLFWTSSHAGGLYADTGSYFYGK